jgi:hypothetical protein
VTHLVSFGTSINDNEFQGDMPTRHNSAEGRAEGRIISVFCEIVAINHSTCGYDNEFHPTNSVYPIFAASLEGHYANARPTPPRGEVSTAFTVLKPFKGKQFWSIRVEVSKVL